MKTIETTVWISFALVAALATSAGAGVVMTQETTKPDRSGGSKTETHTTTIDGNRMKTVTPEITMIMDLDKGTMTIVNPTAKTYSEMPLANFGAFMAAGLSGEFKPTGKKKTIAGFPCEEYKHDFKAFGDVSSVSCVSKDAPGAKEASAFYRSMAKKMAKDAKNVPPDGVVLSEESTMKPMMPEMPSLPPETQKKLRESQAKQPPITTKTVVTAIKSESVAAEAWAVPKDYTSQPTPFQGRPGVKAVAPGAPPPAAK